MSELRPNTTPEYSGSHIDAAPFVSGDELDLQKSNLPSAEQGRKFALEARAAIEAATRREGPRVPTPEQAAREGAQSVMKSGMRIVAFRRQASQPEQPLTQDDYFRLWGRDMAQTYPNSWSDTAGYELTGLHRG